MFCVFCHRVKNTEDALVRSNLLKYVISFNMFIHRVTKQIDDDLLDEPNEHFRFIYMISKANCTSVLCQMLLHSMHVMLTV